MAPATVAYHLIFRSRTFERGVASDRPLFGLYTFHRQEHHDPCRKARKAAVKNDQCVPAWQEFNEGLQRLHGNKVCIRRLRCRG